MQHQDTRNDVAFIRQFLGQAAACGTAADYVWSLELGLANLRRGVERGVISARECEALQRHLVRAYIAGCRLMPTEYDRGRLERGFAGARGVVQAWTIPQPRRCAQSDEVRVCVMHSKILLNDLECLRRADEVARRYAHVVLPPMPTEIEPCEILFFSPQESDQ
ncbi:hypothetical protein [Methylobacterium soli]|uniref:Uncharacterized protein n=1 Tax=Methylobacterium soli TaxID=553447 RepID=A0A6L3SVC9_9HYPH|nr:hypothetical protein [Methylobacterium soli]KAB1075397.1 hypothetical protein F6X53_24825 [Methylobacterium soli]